MTLKVVVDGFGCFVDGQ